MEELHRFVFGTVVCDGCGRRIDSTTANDERLHDVHELLEWKLDELGWAKCDNGKWLCPDCVADPAHRTRPGEGEVVSENDMTYGLRCDHCGKEFENYEGYSIWMKSWVTHEEATDSDWRDIGGKMLCPDCYRDCDAMGNLEDEDEDWVQKYCSKCPHKDDCDEVVERDTPLVDCCCCKSALRIVDTNGVVHYHCCPHLVSGKCTLPEGVKCPRLVTWRIEREEVEESNKGIREWVERERK